MFKVNEIGELLALSKALSIIKFNFNDQDHAIELATSPFIIEVYKRINDAKAEFYKKQNFPYPTEWGEIEAIPNYLNTIFSHILNHYRWNTYSDEEKTVTIEALVSPYLIKEETIKDLINEADKAHSNMKNVILQLLFYRKGESQEDIFLHLNFINKTPFTETEVECFLKELVQERKIYFKNGLWYLNEDLASFARLITNQPV